jgi:hypothetical protein
MTNLHIDHESRRRLTARLDSSEGNRFLDELLRGIALSLVDEWVRSGRKLPPPELAEKQLRDAANRILGND